MSRSSQPKEPNFTPGPWEAQVSGGLPIGVWAGDEDGGRYVCPPNDMSPENTRLADLHLIAAAPELYAALTAADMALGYIIEDAINRLTTDSPMLLIDVRKLDGVVEILRTALAKARGEG